MIKELGMRPGPRMGWILHALLEEVLDAPEKNTVKHLSELAKSLNMLGDAELKNSWRAWKRKKRRTGRKRNYKTAREIWSTEVNFICRRRTPVKQVSDVCVLIYFLLITSFAVNYFRPVGGVGCLKFVFTFFCTMKMVF